MLLKGSGGGAAAASTTEPYSPAAIQAADRGKVVRAGKGKRALFVAPYEWQFDEGIEDQAAKLRELRQYREKDGGAAGS